MASIDEFLRYEAHRRPPKSVMALSPGSGRWTAGFGRFVDGAGGRAVRADEAAGAIKTPPVPAPNELTLGELLAASATEGSLEAADGGVPEARGST